jgi:hypothetical protein
MSSTNSPKLTKAELKKKQKDEELAKKKLQDDLNLVEKKKSKSHSILNNPIIKFKKKEDVSKEIPMSEDEVDEEYTKILKEWGAGDAVIKDELLKPLLHKYNNIVAARKRKEQEEEKKKRRTSSNNYRSL